MEVAGPSHLVLLHGNSVSWILPTFCNSWFCSSKRVLTGRRRVRSAIAWSGLLIRCCTPTFDLGFCLVFGPRVINHFSHLTGLGRITGRNSSSGQSVDSHIQPRFRHVRMEAGRHELDGVAYLGTLRSCDVVFARFAFVFGPSDPITQDSSGTHGLQAKKSGGCYRMAPRRAETGTTLIPDWRYRTRNLPATLSGAKDLPSLALATCATIALSHGTVRPNSVAPSMLPKPLSPPVWRWPSASSSPAIWHPLNQRDAAKDNYCVEATKAKQRESVASTLCTCRLATTPNPVKRWPVNPVPPRGRRARRRLGGS